MNRMPLSVSTFFDYSVSIEEQIRLIAEAGFTHLSLGGREAHSQYLSAAGRQRLRALLQGSGLAIDTIHGPRADQPESAERLTVTALAAAELSVPVVVMHAGPFYFSAEELTGRLDAVIRTCSALEHVARDTGVRFALENVMPGPATDLVELALSQLNPEHFGFCYDSSHDQLGGPRPFNLLERLKSRLAAVHLSDRVREFVDHVLPGEGFIDWPALSAVLRMAPIPIPLLLEVSTEHSAEKDPGRFLQRASQAGRWLSALLQDGDAGEYER